MSVNKSSKTLFDKIWDNHIVDNIDENNSLDSKENQQDETDFSAVDNETDSISSLFNVAKLIS